MREWKHPDDMTVDECRSEVSSLESYFAACAESQCGISSKETVRHRLCKFKVDYFDQLGGTLELGEDTWAFMKAGMEMFAPAEDR
jgi:hypothetical protein